MRPRIATLIAIVAVVGALLLIAFSHPEAKKLWMAFQALNQPIEFYGQVVDTHGKPVEGATILYAAFNDVKIYEKKKPLKTQTDSKGLFSIDGIKGGVLYVKAEHPDYRSLPQSSGSFGYALPGDHPAASDPKHPAILKLQKKGTLPKLISFTPTQFMVAKDGTPTFVDLAKGKITDEQNADIKLEAWTTVDHNRSRPYQWRCRISAPAGGIQIRTNAFDFEAPQEGYQPYLEFKAQTQDPKRWKKSVRGSCFAKLGDGNYARIDFYFTSGGAHFFVLESDLNPNGSRNLEK